MYNCRGNDISRVEGEFGSTLLEAELWQVIKPGAPRKSPEEDGIPAEFCK
jgi:hypothetical protein